MGRDVILVLSSRRWFVEILLCSQILRFSPTAEIERVMKKVDEGVELFDEIWEKVYAAEQQNQKEKYEMDLKKEIKKLQRLRDQIKTWIGSSDVKDKDDLIEARKLIETKMEQFKVCEKETKTKTYSKEGLARAERLDPGERAKLDTESWIRDYIEQLQQLVEDADVEIERLSAGKGKKTNKAQIDDLMHHIAQHKFHIHKLEGIIRLVINDVLDVDLVDPLKDDLDYYVDSNNDEDYQQAYDEEFFYESLGLDELDVVDVDRVTQIDPKKDATAKSDDSSASTGQGGSKNKKDKRLAPASIPLKIGRATSKTKSAEEEKVVVVTPVKKVLAPAPARPPPPPPTSGGASMAAILKREQDQEKERQQKALLVQVCFEFYDESCVWSHLRCPITHSFRYVYRDNRQNCNDSNSFSCSCRKNSNSRQNFCAKKNCSVNRLKRRHRRNNSCFNNNSWNRSVDKKQPRRSRSNSNKHKWRPNKLRRLNKLLRGRKVWIFSIMVSLLATTLIRMVIRRSTKVSVRRLILATYQLLTNPSRTYQQWPIVIGRSRTRLGIPTRRRIRIHLFLHPFLTILLSLKSWERMPCSSFFTMLKGPISNTWRHAS